MLNAMKLYKARDCNAGHKQQKEAGRGVHILDLGQHGIVSTIGWLGS